MRDSVRTSKEVSEKLSKVESQLAKSAVVKERKEEPQGGALSTEIVSVPTIAGEIAGSAEEGSAVGGKVTKIVVVMSSMRRNIAEEHVHGTIESLAGALGADKVLDLRLMVVDVERGDGAFGRVIEERHKRLVEEGLLRVRHLSDEAREKLYAELKQTCSMARLYGDDLPRTIWRSKRVLDFVWSTRLAATEADYVLVLEDDTPAVGAVRKGLMDCVRRYGGEGESLVWSPFS